MALDAGGAVGIVIAVVAVVIVIYLLSCCYLVSQSEAVIIERLGKFHRVLAPGLNFVAPFLDSPRSFSWHRITVDQNKKLVDQVINSYRVDLRECLFAFPPQEVFSKDTVLLSVACVMFYRIVDVRAAVYNVNDLAQAVSDTAQSQLKRIFGGMTFAEALQSQPIINAAMRSGISSTYEKWGLQVERVELNDLRPKASSQTANAMKSQMIAERNRRSEFITAEGNKAAMKLRSEGAKLVKANLGIAEQEATRKRSEGEAVAKVEMARAEKIALDTIAESIEADSSSQTGYTLAKRFNELLRSSAAAVRDKVIYLPYEVASISGVIGNLPESFAQSSRALAAASSGAPVPLLSTLAPRAAYGPAGTASVVGGARPFSELD